MAAHSERSTRPAVEPSASRGVLSAWHAMRRLAAVTFGICMRYRVTGLAAEGAFFGVLSLPPLIFGLAGTVGYVVQWFGTSTVQQLSDQIIRLAGNIVTPDIVADIISPTVNEVLHGGRADVISVGFLLALWSGSRALNVFVDTISIMYGFGGHRGIVRTRALSFTVYVVALAVGIIALPLVLAGPELVQNILPDTVAWLQALYWPVVLLGSVLVLTALYRVAVPIRTPWLNDFPGATLCLALWVGGAFALRWTLSEATGGTSIYGPLATPIAVLILFYVLAIAVLIGAALNAAWDQLWPSSLAVRSRRDRTKTS